jgi:hypothetical protein
VVVWVVVGSAVMAIIDLIDPVRTPGESCGLGTAVGFLSILAGGFLGTIGGSVLAVKRPIFTAQSH